MKKRNGLKNIIIFFIILGFALVLSIQFQAWNVEEHITTIFAFAVFLISLLTDGYVYGVAASVVGMFAINFVFTYPYFAFDFINPINLISAVIMVSISVITSLLVTKIKQHETSKAENEREHMLSGGCGYLGRQPAAPVRCRYGAGAARSDAAVFGVPVGGTTEKRLYMRYQSACLIPENQLVRRTGRAVGGSNFGA